jgi:hypothetical protein
MTLLIVQSSPYSYYFLSVRSKYTPQHPAFKHPQSYVFPLVQEVQFNARNFSKKLFFLRTYKSILFLYSHSSHMSVRPFRRYSCAAEQSKIESGRM